MTDHSTPHDDHGTVHDDHGTAAAGHGHSADPNAGVVRATAPTPAWVLTSALIGLVTVIAAIVIAFALNDAIPSEAPPERIETEQGEHAEGPPAPEATH